MDIDSLTSKILGARAPRVTHTFGAWTFEIETPSQIEWMRHRMNASRPDGQVDAVQVTLNALEQVVGWSGVTAKDFPVDGLEREDADTPIPFSPSLLRKFVENRAEVLRDLFGAVRRAHDEYLLQQEADRKNLLPS